MSKRTIVEYKNFRLVVLTKEQNHKFLPHCHVIEGKGKGKTVARIHLKTLEIISNEGGLSERDIKKFREFDHKRPRSIFGEME
jgi:hypothetical protein